MPSAEKRATSVHACFGSVPRTPAATSFCTRGWLAFGIAAGESVFSDECEHLGLGLIERGGGHEAMIEVHREEVGDDVAPAAAVRERHRGGRPIEQTVDDVLRRREHRESIEEPCRFGDRVLAFPGTRAVARLAFEGDGRVDRSAASEVEAIVGGLEADREVDLG
jgi:hypothetical protein